MKTRNWFVSVGCLLLATALVLKHVLPGLPDFIYGLCFGIGIGLELMGLYVANHDISPLKRHKRNLFRKIFH